MSRSPIRIQGNPVTDVCSHLVPASAAAVHKACEQSQQERAALPGAARMSSVVGKALTGLAFCQVHNAGQGKMLVDSLSEFSSMMCAALPAVSAATSPAAAAGWLKCSWQYGRAASAGVRSRYCRAADQHKHWKQHMPVCRAVAAARAAAVGDQQPKHKHLQKHRKAKKQQRVLPSGCEMVNHI